MNIQKIPIDVFSLSISPFIQPSNLIISETLHSIFSQASQDELLSVPLILIPETLLGIAIASELQETFGDALECQYVPLSESFKRLEDNEGYVSKNWRTLVDNPDVTIALDDMGRLTTEYAFTTRLNRSITVETKTFIILESPLARSFEKYFEVPVKSS